MRFKSISALLILLSLAVADEKAQIAKEIKIDLKRIDEIATQTKENEVYQPYIISVFRGKDLEKIGVANLKEALELIPGLDMSTDNVDNKTPVFRGSNPFAYGQSKLIIDGVVVNNLMFDSYVEYLYMPIEIIKRIEVVRGPGSKTDGVNAYAGSIRVTTYAERFDDLGTSERIFVKGGSYDYVGAGMTKSLKIGEASLFLDLFYQRDNKSVKSGKDILSTGIYDLFSPQNSSLSREGDAPLWMRNYSFGATLNYGAWTFRSRLLYYRHGSAYGINYMLPESDDHTTFSNNFAEAEYKKETTLWIYDIKAGYKWDSFFSEALLAPAGIVFPNPLDANALVEYDNGFYGIHEVKNRTYYNSAFFTYKGEKKHKIKFGYLISKEETYKVTTKTTDRFNIFSGLIDYSETYPFFDENAKRDSLILSLQDDFEITDRLTVSYGVNYEDNTHISPQLNPRVALVYRHREDIYKFIYSRSIRNPSWQELYTINNSARRGNLDLDPEIVNAFEAAYIKRFGIDSFWKLNIFYLRNRDQINRLNEKNMYMNAQNTKIYGFESEWKSQIGQRGRVRLNYSYVDGKNDENEPLANVAKHMLKGYLSYDISTPLTISLTGKYVGDKRRMRIDDRKTLKGYATLDLALEYDNLADGYSIGAALKNIFDEDVRYPSEPYTYVSDYKQEGRNFMITFRMRF